jgi:hypothetical protein
MRQLAKDFSRTKDFVASSAAALVSEAVYKSNQPNKSTQLFRKSQKICKWLIQQGTSTNQSQSRQQSPDKPRRKHHDPNGNPPHSRSQAAKPPASDGCVADQH